MNERPLCDIVEGCNNPAVLVIAGRNVCGEHALKWHNKKQEELRKEFED